jgi:hypothetical protein
VSPVTRKALNPIAQSRRRGSIAKAKYFPEGCIDKLLKLVFHFNRIVLKRSVFLCFLTTRVELMTSTQKKMLRYVTIRLKWKTGFKPVFHFNRIVAKRSVFLCFLTTRVELMISTQKKMLRYVTIWSKWKTGFSVRDTYSCPVKPCLVGWQDAWRAKLYPWRVKSFVVRPKLINKFRLKGGKFYSIYLNLF